MIGEEFGVYRIMGLLGAGAMGTVYLAEHTVLHRPCALKILSAGAAERDPQYVERFIEEGRAAAALVHPNIITVHAIGVIDGHYFLEMELLPCGTLEPSVDGHAGATALRIAQGLATAHDSNVIHRDLKPDNILMTHDGVPKIADFGLAKRLASADGAQLMGTPSFMAPELFRGTEANKRSDVYALGVVLHLLLTGRLPYDADTLSELIRRVVHEPLPDLPDVSAGLRRALATLLAKEPDERPRNGGEAVHLLTDALARDRDLEVSLRSAFSDRQNVTWEREGARWRVRLRFPDGRGQAVILEPSGELVLIYSVCCHAAPEHHEYALRLNSEMEHGALAIREVDGIDVFVMLDTYPLATVDVEEIRRSVLEVAQRADEVEHRLTGEDRN